MEMFETLPPLRVRVTGEEGGGQEMDQSLAHSQVLGDRVTVLQTGMGEINGHYKYYHSVNVALCGEFFSSWEN